MKVIIGCAVQQPGWIGTTIERFNILKEDNWLQFPGLTALFAEHVWEHLTPDEGRRAAELCYKYLEPGGYIRVAVPDGLHPDESYIAWVVPGGNGPGCDDHKVLYSYLSLDTVFRLAGFQVTLLEYWDETGHFQIVDWNPDDGKVRRSYRYDSRNADGVPRYTSIILDARKPDRSARMNYISRLREPHYLDYTSSYPGWQGHNEIGGLA